MPLAGPSWVPEPSGSGKFFTPCARMHFDRAIVKAPTVPPWPAPPPCGADDPPPGARPPPPAVGDPGLVGLPAGGVAGSPEPCAWPEHAAANRVAPASRAATAR